MHTAAEDPSPNFLPDKKKLELSVIILEGGKPSFERSRSLARPNFSRIAEIKLEPLEAGSLSGLTSSGSLWKPKVSKAHDSLPVLSKLIDANELVAKTTAGPPARTEYSPISTALPGATAFMVISA